MLIYVRSSYPSHVYNAMKVLERYVTSLSVTAL